MLAAQPDRLLFDAGSIGVPGDGAGRLINPLDLKDRPGGALFFLSSSSYAREIYRDAHALFEGLIHRRRRTRKLTV